MRKSEPSKNKFLRVGIKIVFKANGTNPRTIARTMTGNQSHAAFICDDIVFRSIRFPFFVRRVEDDSLPDHQATVASDGAVDSRVVLVRTNDRL